MEREMSMITYLIVHLLPLAFPFTFAYGSPLTARTSGVFIIVSFIVSLITWLRIEV
jgi:hypothetical protein